MEEKEYGRGGRKYWSIENCFKEEPLQLTKSQIHRECDTGLHAHEFYEMSIVLHGSGWHFLEDICVPVSPGNVFVIPPKILHSFRQDTQLDVLNILIRREFLQKYEEETAHMPGFSRLFEIEPYLRKVVGEGFFLKLPAGELQLLKPEWERLLWYSQHSCYVNHNIAVLHLIARFGLQLYQDFEDRVHPDIVYVMEYINQHLSEKLTLQGMAELSHMSLSSFRRFFQKHTAMSPMQYVMMCRVDLVKRLLAEGRLSRAQIAAACGFYDISHMNKYLQSGR